MRVPCRLVLAPLAAMLFAAALPAQNNTELLNRMKAMEDRIHALEAEVLALKGQPAPVPVAAQATPGGSGTPGGCSTCDAARASG